MGIAEAVERTAANEIDSCKTRSLHFSLEGMVEETIDWTKVRWLNHDVGAKPPESHANSISTDLETALETGSHLSQPSASVAQFVKNCFIPEHVAMKRSGGRAH